ncbi:MAG: hypothetical protein KAJ07_04715 [Planctomycetes bacterium]|nr:hypothetical protein [Planctomycetota bacterium]
MKPIKFDDRCVNYAEAQEEYNTLPVLRVNYEDGSKALLSCWHLSFIERLRLLFSGRVYLWIMGTRQPPVLLGLEGVEDV